MSGPAYPPPYSGYVHPAPVPGYSAAPGQAPAAVGYSEAAYPPAPMHGGYPPPMQGSYAPPQAPAYGAVQPTGAGGVYTATNPAYEHTAVPVVAEYGVKPANPASGGGYLAQMEKMQRMGFIRKVYGILSVQLLVTFGIVLVFSLVDSVKRHVQNNPGMLYAAIGVTLATIIALTCCRGVARKVPGNYICLFVFTLAEAYLLGTIASYYTTTSVAWALGATVLLTLALTAFAWQTRIDFTTMSGSLFVILIAFIMFGIWSAIFRSQVLQTLYAALGVIVFGIFLVYDTQLIVGGKHRAVSLTSDEYIFAALNLYIDIVQLFLYILRLFGSRD